MPEKISAVIIVKNGALSIAKTLDSLCDFDEVLVYDNGSTDDTQRIVTGRPNCRFIQDTFEGFGVTRNKAVSQAKHNWILILDADEVLERELSEYLRTHDFNPKVIYRLNFKAFYKHIQVRHCGWSNQKISRFYHRENSRFTEDYVHEILVEVGLTVEDINQGSVLHFSYESLSDFIRKVDHYSSLYAQSNQGKKSSSPLKAFLSGIYSFFRTYILKRGFLDGYVGLIISFSHMATNFYKYMKLYEANKELQQSQLTHRK